MESRWKYTDNIIKSEPDPPRPGESGPDYWRRVSREDPGSSDEPPEAYWNGPDDHGMRPMNDPDYGPVPDEYRSNGMSRAAFACGVLSLLTMLFGGGVFFGLLGVLFACLSRRRRFSRQARAALTMCVVSIAAFAVNVILVVLLLVSSGSWDQIVRDARNLDVTDQESVESFESDIYSAVIRAVGGAGTPFESGSILNPQNPNIDAGTRARENASAAAKEFRGSETESVSSGTVEV